jgi:trehalose utilization protein
MYGEPFDIPAPEELIFLSWFKGGEVFRSGCTFPSLYEGKEVFPKVLATFSP